MSADLHLVEMEVVRAVMSEPRDTDGWGEGVLRVLRQTHQTPLGPIRQVLNLAHLDAVRLARFSRTAA